MAALNIPLSDDLQHQIKQVARDQNRQPTEVLEEAVRKYLEERSWTATLAYGRSRAEAVGITTGDGIDKAISEWRKHNAQHGP